MQLQQKLQVQYGQELVLDTEDVEKMRKAFAGIYLDPRRRSHCRVHLEAGQATMTDGSRLHTISVKYNSHMGVDVDLEQLQQVWKEPQALRVQPNFADDGFWQWREIIPKADLAP
jgi:hypothetical protein